MTILLFAMLLAWSCFFGHQRLLEKERAPVGAKQVSPALQRWVRVQKGLSRFSDDTIFGIADTTLTQINV